MDKLERYLDQVCRGIAGPRSLRRHVRQELREHIRDAAADHLAAGLSEEAALDKALEDFGGPEQVHSELEATHGHSLLSVVVDNAMAWKETTMKAKLLWSTAAHLMLQLTVAAEITLLAAVGLLVVPKQEQILQDVMRDVTDPEAVRIVGWSTRTLDCLVSVGSYFGWIVLASLLLTILFEWRVKAEHKPAMRMTALGALALALMIGIGFVTAALVLPWLMLVPGIQKQAPEPIVRDRVAAVESSAAELERLIRKPEYSDDDRRAMVQAYARVRNALGDLNRVGAAAPTLVAMKQPAEDTTAVREDLKAANAALHQMDFMADEDAAAERATLERQLNAFHATFDRVRPMPLEERLKSVRGAFGPDAASSTQPAK